MTNFALIILYSVYSTKNLAIGLLACYNKLEKLDIKSIFICTNAA